MAKRSHVELTTQRTASVPTRRRESAEAVDRVTDTLPRWLPWAVAVGLALVTIALYWPVLNHPFVNFDDNVYIIQNIKLHEGLSWQTIGWASTSVYASNWHPLTWISHLLDVSLFGVAPSGAHGHHLTSLLLHVFNTVLLFLVLRSATNRLWPSAVVAALFGWHPLHVESVAWVAERKDVLSGLFFFLTLAAYLWYARKPQSWGRYLLVVVALGLGLMAKPMLVTVPFVLLMWDYWPLGRWTPEVGRSESTRRAGQLVLEKAPLFALVVASSAITYYVQQAGGAMQVGSILSREHRLANAITAYVEYLRKAVWPTDLSIYYPYQVQDFNQPIVWLSLGLLVTVSVVVAMAVRRGAARGYLPVGWFWYLGMLVPVIGLVQVGSQALADRYTYLPLIGIFIAVVWAVSDALQRWPGWRMVVVLATAVLLIACVAQARVQIGYWQDLITLYRRAVELNPSNQMAQVNLGGELLNRAMAERSRELASQAAHHYELAVKLDRTFFKSHDGLGMAYAALGDYRQAVAELRKAQSLSPTKSPPMNNLAWVLATSPDPSVRDGNEAVRFAEMACEQFEYRNPRYLDTLAVALAAAGRFDDAVRMEDRAIQMFREIDYRDDLEQASARRKQFADHQEYVDNLLPIR